MEKYFAKRTLLPLEAFEDMRPKPLPPLEGPLTVYYTKVWEYDPDDRSFAGYCCSLKKETLARKMHCDNTTRGQNGNCVYRHSPIEQALTNKDIRAMAEGLLWVDKLSALDLYHKL